MVILTRILMTSQSLRRRLGAIGPASVADFDIAAVTSEWERLLQETSGLDHRNDSAR
jgi:hypothetical protein